MKIRTQSLVLILGTLVVPTLVLALVLVVFRISFATQEAARFESSKAEWAEGKLPTEAEVIGYLTQNKPKEIELAIGNPEGRVIYSSIEEIRSGQSFAEEVVRAANLSRHDSILILSLVPDPPVGYTIVVSIPTSSILPSMVFQNYIVAALLALAALVAFAAVMCISIVRSITTSILSLEEATRKVAAGELDTPIVAVGSNEMASLARSLNSLREEIKEDQARRSRFIMGISHDLKSPLALVKGYAEAVEGCLSGAEKDALGYLKIIEDKADQLEGMIDDLIDFVRMDTGEWSSGLAEVEIEPFLSSFMKRVSSDARILGRSASFSTTLPPGFRVKMGEKLVTRALENLVFNALRYTPEGGHVSVSAIGEGNSCTLHVRDDGPGMRKEDLSHVFEPFYRGTSSRREQGMGLGLSIVKTIVETHGWSISAESGEGQGSVFSIHIPSSQAEKRINSV